MLTARSGISQEIVEQRGYRTVTKEQVLELDFPAYQARPGLLMPVHGTCGKVVSHQLRPDSPRISARTNRTIKYESVGGRQMRVDCPPACQRFLLETSKAVWITEGIKKADALATTGAMALGLLGVTLFRGTHAGGGKAVLPDFEHVAWNRGRLTYICFDSDFQTNHMVCDAMARIGALCQSWGASVLYVQIPSADGSKVGIDDYLVAGGRLEDLIATATPYPPHAPPKSISVTLGAFMGEGKERFALTDLGNAKRLAAIHGDDIRWCQSLGRWLTWDGQKWEIDEGSAGEVFRLAQDVTRQVAEEAARAEGDEQKTLLKHALAMQSRKALTDMVTLLKTLPGIEVSVDSLDRDPNLLNVANGTLNLRTFEMRPHDRNDLLTRCIDIDYDPDAEVDCPLWIDFLETILMGNVDLLRYVFKACGYTLTGETSEKCFFFLHGNKGDNGKSVFIATLMRILGPYASSTPSSTLLAKINDGAIPNDLARLRGVRAVSASETEEGKRLDEAMIKQLTGGDRISARFMRAEWFDFLPTFKIWMTGNHKPIVRGQDKAIWRRIKLIPFLYSVPHEKQDKDLVEKLWQEKEGILAWLVDGCMAWRKERLGTPEIVTAAVAEYREEMDELGRFIEECCIESPSMSVSAQTFYSAYEKWTKVNGIKPMTSTAFGRKMVERGYERSRSSSGNIYRGIAVKQDEVEASTYRGGE